MEVQDHASLKPVSLPLKCAFMADEFRVAPDLIPSPDAVLGVLAYGFPGSTSGDVQSHIWVIAVSSCAQNSGITSQQIMNAAVDALGIAGVIRGTDRCFRSVGKLLGRGGYGSARLVRRRRVTDFESVIQSDVLTKNLRDQELFVAKLFSNGVSEEKVLHEINTLVTSQGHPNVLQFLGSYCKNDGLSTCEWALLTRAYVRGDIYHTVLKTGAFSAQDALRLASDVLSALHHVHSRGVLHLDVKPANVVCDEKGGAVLIDFGCCIFRSKSTSFTLRSTVGHIAPELLTKRMCTPKADVFSCGTVLYFMLSGVNPFEGSDEDDIMALNAAGSVNFPIELFNHVSFETQHVTRSLLASSHRRRPGTTAALSSVRQALSHLPNQLSSALGEACKGTCDDEFKGSAESGASTAQGDDVFLPATDSKEAPNLNTPSSPWAPRSDEVFTGISCSYRSESSVTSSVVRFESEPAPRRRLGAILRDRVPFSFAFGERLRFVSRRRVARFSSLAE
eukprot:TRINITY_DN40284_c0_g1_i1.p1 TRINITY_DN40284_c0_g1~~TRINITY_DN40284_c0_g1_i1.p1  ORF type:complete len:579 (+),score=75.52 TRINITY_DN40284_c0_g1_i1:220-1737(+)